MPAGRGPDLILIETERGELTAPKTPIRPQEILVKLRRRHPCARQHGVHLATMVHLVVEKVK